MSYITRQQIKTDKPIRYNNIDAKTLPSANIPADSVAAIGSVRMIQGGTFICAIPNSVMHKPLARALVASPYTAGTTSVIVSNPTVFKPGDTLYTLAPPGLAPTAELAAIRGEPTALGTVVSVNGLNRPQIFTVTPAAPTIGNIFTLIIEGATLTFVATAATVASITAGLKKAFDSMKNSYSSLENIAVTDNSTALTITGDDGQIFTLAASVAPGEAATEGTLTASVTQPVGALTITPASATNGNAAIGTKIGTTNDIVIGILDRTYYLTDVESGVDHDIVVAPYNSAMLYRNALPYLDADVVDQLKELSYTPAYGV